MVYTPVLDETQVAERDSELNEMEKWDTEISTMFLADLTKQWHTSEPYV